MYQILVTTSVVYKNNEVSVATAICNSILQFDTKEQALHALSALVEADLPGAWTRRAVPLWYME
jgi:hypothetical protein